jgi:HEAT repeat protein
LGALGERAAGEEVIAALLDRLSDAEGDVRFAAARALGKMGERAAGEEVIVALLERLSDAEGSVRSSESDSVT